METMTSMAGSSSVRAQNIDSSSSSETKLTAISMETDKAGVVKQAPDPYVMETDKSGVLKQPRNPYVMFLECFSADEVSVRFSRKFPKTMGFKLQPFLPMVKSTMESYGFSCELNMDNWYGEMTFTTSSSTDEDIIHRARVVLQLLQIDATPSLAFKVMMSGSSFHIIQIGNQKDGLVRKFRIKLEQFVEGKKHIRKSLQELEKLTGCDIWMSEETVVAVGTCQGARVVRKIVEECILHKVAPAPRIRGAMRILAMRGLEALRFWIVILV